jgi:PP-loop superfamily ATP-utilizing enzyme
MSKRMVLYLYKVLFMALLRVPRAISSIENHRLQKINNEEELMTSAVARYGILNMQTTTRVEVHRFLYTKIFSHTHHSLPGQH